MRLSKTAHYSKVEKKFFKQHGDLLSRYAQVLKKLQIDPFEPSLKTHKLKGELKEYYACSLTHSYRIILTIQIIEDQVVLLDIGNHDKVY